jgi:argininosuccinate lyase
MDDSHCRTSVIMPHKKNPYALAHVRGSARKSIGTWTSIVNSNLTASGQPDNRTISYEALPELIEELNKNCLMMGEIIKLGTFNRKVMRENTLKGYTISTDLCDFLLEHRGIDNRSAHKLVGKAVRTLVDQGDVEGEKISLEIIEQSAKTIGLDIDTSKIKNDLDHFSIVENLLQMRQTIGGSSVASLESMRTSIQKKCTDFLNEWNKYDFQNFEVNFKRDFDLRYSELSVEE